MWQRLARAGITLCCQCCAERCYVPVATHVHTCNYMYISALRTCASLVPQCPTERVQKGEKRMSGRRTHYTRMTAFLPTTLRDANKVSCEAQWVLLPSGPTLAKRYSMTKNVEKEDPYSQ
jgi:hypothetical protein